MNPNERVLCVPTARFRQAGYFQGFCGVQVENYLRTILDPEHLSFRPRGEVEEDPSFKQLIPYVLFRYRSPGLEDQLFQYTRTTGTGEQRLLGRRSIGVGGHISAEDGTVEKSYQVGMQRELAEEVTLLTDYTTRVVGLLNDDTSPVGQVHLGIVHLYECKHPGVAAKEESFARWAFHELHYFWDAVPEFETWSQLCLQALRAQAF